MANQRDRTITIVETNKLIGLYGEGRVIFAGYVPSHEHTPVIVGPYDMVIGCIVDWEWWSGRMPSHWRSVNANNAKK